MVLLKIQLEGRMVGGTKYVRGYVDREEWHENRVYAKYLLFGKIPIYKKELWSEEVPLWAVIKRSTLGYSEWRSKKPNLIDACIENRVLKVISF